VGNSCEPSPLIAKWKGKEASVKKLATLAGEVTHLPSENLFEEYDGLYTAQQIQWTTFVVRTVTCAVDTACCKDSTPLR